MKTILLILSLAVMLSCSQQPDGIVQLELPLTGETIAEHWPSIIGQAEPCELPGCGTDHHKLFRVNYPNFSLLFVGKRTAEFDPFQTYLNVFKEKDKEVTDYDLLIHCGDRSFVLEDHKMSHLTDGPDMLAMDYKISINDTGLYIPSRQASIVQTLADAVRDLPQLQIDETYTGVDLFNMEFTSTPPTEFHFRDQSPMGYWELGKGELLYLNSSYAPSDGGELEFFLLKGGEVVSVGGFWFDETPANHEILVLPGPVVKVDGEVVKMALRNNDLE